MWHLRGSSSELIPRRSSLARRKKSVFMELYYKLAHVKNLNLHYFSIIYGTDYWKLFYV
jgi:hypothetical protein